MYEKTSTRPAAEIIRTHVERLAHEAEERLQKRQLALAEQTAHDNPPDVRIRAWERAHALRLPGDPGHPVLRSVAGSTGLTIAQVQEEQRARRLPAAGVPGSAEQVSAADSTAAEPRRGD